MKLFPIFMFCLLGVIWGSAFIYMKLASELITPIQIVLLRVIFGAIPIAAYAFFKGFLSWRHVKHIHHFLVMALIATIAYYYGFARGASLLLSGVAGALSGLTPLLSFLLALLLLREERATLPKMTGIVIGFMGVLLIARPFGAGLATANLEGVFFNLVGSFSVGASFVYARKYIVPLALPVSAVITYQLVLALVILFFFADLNGIGNIWSSPIAATGLVVGLGLVGTGLAYIIYYYIIDQLGAVAASSVSYIPPVVAIAIGVIIVGEDIGLWDYLGTMLIFFGVFLVNRSAIRTTERSK